MSRLPVAAGLLLGVLADEILGDPQRAHPVAAFGSAAHATEVRLYADTHKAGAAFTAACTVPLVTAAALVDRTLSGTTRAAVLASATWTVIGGRSLRKVGIALADALDADQTERARALIPSLCGRDPASLDADGMVRAALESIAENTSDSVVAPLFCGAVAGLPGLLGYRAINTLDAMVGHRSPRYARFGTASARLDDVANLAPARLTALLTVLLAPAVGGSATGAYRAWRRDAGAHPSPNAGHCEASMAGALGIELGGPTVYRGRTEERPRLGDGRTPTTADLRRAVRLSHLVQSGATAILVGTVVFNRIMRRPGSKVTS